MNLNLSHMTAISALYQLYLLYPVEGRKIGNHPRVSDFIFGIYGQRPS